MVTYRKNTVVRVGVDRICRYHEEFSAACPGLATSIFDNSLGMEPLALSKNEALKKKYFAKILKDFKLICFATSEPTMGSDVAGIRCRAEREGETTF